MKRIHGKVADNNLAQLIQMNKAATMLDMEDSQSSSGKSNDHSSLPPPRKKGR